MSWTSLKFKSALKSTLPRQWEDIHKLWENNWKDTFDKLHVQNRQRTFESQQWENKITILKKLSKDLDTSSMKVEHINYFQIIKVAKLKQSWGIT